MPRRSSDKNQQSKMKKASNAIGADRDFGNDPSESRNNEIRGRN